MCVCVCVCLFVFFFVFLCFCFCVCMCVFFFFFLLRVIVGTNMYKYFSQQVAWNENHNHLENFFLGYLSRCVRDCPLEKKLQVVLVVFVVVAGCW